MAEEVSIPIDASGFDRLLTSVGETTKASKEMGDALKKALLGEVVVNGINRVASSMKDGVAKSSLEAASAITQGFFAGGPVGAALAATAVAVTRVGDAWAYVTNSAQTALDRMSRAKAQAALVASETQVKQDLRNETLAEIERAALAEKHGKEQQEAERKRLAQLAKEKREAKKKHDAEAKEYVEAVTLQIAQLESDIQEQAFADELDAEAEQAKRLRDQRDEDAAKERQRLQDEQMYALAVRAEDARQVAALEKQAADARQKREAEAARRRDSERKALTARIDSDFSALGNTLGGGLAGGVGNAVAALTALDAAQIAAAVSAKDFGQNAAVAAARATSAVLQSVAQEATVKALMYGAEGLAALVVAPPTAPPLFAASAGMAAAAVAAGAGAVALNTAAGPAPRAPSSSSSSRQETSAPSGGGGGRSTTIVVNANGALITRDDLGASIDAAMRDAVRFGRV